MSYTAPAGNAVELIFDGAYAAPAGNAVELDFDPPVVVIAATLDDAILVCLAEGNLWNLNFSGAYTPPPGNAVELDFDPLPPGIHNAGIVATLDDAIADVIAVASAPIVLTAQLDDVTAVITTGTVHFVAIAALLDDCLGAVITIVTAPIELYAVLDDVAVGISTEWYAGVWRGLESSKQGTFITNQTRVDKVVNDGSKQSIELHPEINALWQPAMQMPAERGSNWHEVARKHVAKTVGWDFIPAQHHEALSGYNLPPRKFIDDAIKWQIAGAITQAIIDTYSSPPRKPYQPKFAYDEGNHVAYDWLAGFGLATVTNRRWSVLLWQTANPHSWIWGGWHYPPPLPAPAYTPSTDLVSCQPMEDFIGGAILDFKRHCYVRPLISRRTTFNNGVTIVLHTVKVTRLPDLADIPALSATLQFDIDSWAWGVSLNLKGPQAMSLLEPVNGEPRQVRVEVDGIYVTVLIEEWGERQQFGETTYTASGRSPLALMAQPFAPIRSYLETSQQTAAQLIDHELINTGWSASYHSDLLQLFTIDWLIPGGAWSYQNKAPIDAIVQIAKAAGARAFADRNSALIHIAPRYAVSPWNWATATPDEIIPLSLVRNISSQLAPQPNYNQIYVSGQSQGIIVSATRQGSAGDKPAPMVSDSLITYVNAGRERARNVLANTGRQARVTIELPLNDITGLLYPGKLVEISGANAWRGLVTDINVSAAHGAISQQVKIERHY